MTAGNFQHSGAMVIEIDLKRLPKVEKCYHNSKKLLEKKLINCELLCSAFCSMITKTTYQMFYECMDCKEKWTETKKDIRIYDTYNI